MIRGSGQGQLRPPHCVGSAGARARAARIRPTLSRFILMLCVLPILPAPGTGAQAEPESPTQVVLCKLGAECRLTTLAGCVAMGGVADPPWEMCLPVVDAAADRAGRLVPDLNEESAVLEDCRFPAAIAIRGRNRLVYRAGAYEVEFGSGSLVRVDFDTGRFCLAESLQVAPAPALRVRSEDLKRLGGFFGIDSHGIDPDGVRRDLDLHRDRAASAGAGPPAMGPNVACAWLHILRLLEQTGSPVEVHVEEGELSLIMAPLGR